MTATAETYPPAVADTMPLPEAEPRAVPRRRLCVVDIHLQGPPVRVPSRESDAFSGHLHGWLYRLQGESLDDRRPVAPDQDTAPFGAWLLGPGHPGAREGQVGVRVCWYSEGAWQRCVASLAASPVAIIGTQPYRVAGIVPVTRVPVYASDLLELAVDAHRLEVQTISPLAFSSHTRWSCSVDGPTVLGSALARWRKVWPGTLPADVEAALGPGGDRGAGLGWMGRVLVSDCELRTEHHEIGKVRCVALRGRWTYDLLSCDHASRRRLALVLLRAAEIFGLGSRCAYGLGAIRVEVVR